MRPALRFLLLMSVFSLVAAGQAASQEWRAAWQSASEMVWPRGGYTEGPTFNSAGDLFISFPRSGRVEVMRRDGREEVWLTGVEGVNGHLVEGSGDHILLSRPRVLRLSSQGEIIASVSEHDGQPFVFPNDLVSDGSGGYWFTDSGSRTEATGKVYHLTSDFSVSEAAAGLAFPNGILLSPDGLTLYVSQSQANDVLAFTVDGNRRLSSPRIFARLPEEGLDQAKNAPDGMCMDAAGHLYVTHNGMGLLHVFSPAGEQLGRYRTGLLASSNCSVGPDDRIYVTGSITFETGPGGVIRMPSLNPPPTPGENR